jgi:flagellar assembly protein FliH
MERGAYALTVPFVTPQAPARAAVEADALFAAEHGARPPLAPAFDEPGEAIEPAAPAVDLEALRAEADALLVKARAEADALVLEARAQAQLATGQAQARVAEIEAESHARGFESGEKAGRAAADAEMEDMLETMRGLIDVARTERVKLLENAEPELVRLATEIAERVVHQHVSVEPESVVTMTRQALQRLIAREKVTVRVNPADVETLRNHREALLNSHDVESVRVVEDQRVDRGGVLIETESGTIDAKVSSQLREARRVLRVEELAATQAS